MASFKLKKFPKKPKRGASIEVMEKFLARCNEIKKQNAKIIADRKKAEMLRKKIDEVIKKQY